MLSRSAQELTNSDTVGQHVCSLLLHTVPSFLDLELLLIYTFALLHFKHCRVSLYINLTACVLVGINVHISWFSRRRFVGESVLEQSVLSICDVTREDVSPEKS